MGFEDIFRIAGVGILLALLHVFLELNNKSEYSFFISVTAFLYFSIELLRMVTEFFKVIQDYLRWLNDM